MHSLKNRFIKQFLVFLAFAGFSLMSNAEGWSENLYLNGYFTIDVSQANHDMQVLSSAGVIRRYEESKLSAKNSLIGGQLEYQFTDSFSLFAQGIAYYDHDDKLSSDITWAYLSYDLGYDLKARVGVFQTPFLQGTELRTVGYSRLWARPLTPGTGASGINKYKGLDLVKRLTTGDYSWELQVALGNGEHDLDDVDVDGVQAVSAKLIHQNFWLRTALMRAKYSVTTPRGQLIISDTDVLMASIEAEMSLEHMVVNAGYSESDSKVTPNDKMYYLSLSHPFGDLTPYISLVKRNQYFEAFDVPVSQNNPGSRPPPPTPDGNANMYSTGVGVRWNFAERLALKAQLEDIRTTDDTNRRDSIPNTSGAVLTLTLEGAF